MMAAGWRSLAVLLTRNSASSTCKVYQRTLANSVHTQLRGQRNSALSRLCVPPTTSTATTTCKSYSTKIVDSTPTTQSTAEEVVEQPPGIFKRMWRWLITDYDDDQYEMGPEEREERDQLLIKLQEMYFADPPVEPDLDFCKEVLRMLIKYDDRLGVETAWELMKELKVKPDEELEYIVPTFIKESREKLK